LNAVEEINQSQYKIVLDKLKKHLKSLKGKKIAVWGLSFKPKTDDVRETPSAKIIKELIQQGAIVSAFDPVAMGEFKKHYPNLNVYYGRNRDEVLEDANALTLVTEWDEFRTLNFKKLNKLMTSKLIIDGRNIYEPHDLKVHNIAYEFIGRPT